VRVLYASHTGQISGGERSLLDLLAGLPNEVIPTVACPPGRMTDAVKRLGITVAAIPETDGSLRVHPWYTTRALFQVAGSALRLRYLAKRTDAELIHANSIRAGLAASLASRTGGPPVVVHLRDCLPASPLATMTRGLLAMSASMLIANSRYTACSFGIHAGSPRITTIYNPVDLDRFNRAARSPAEARRRLGLNPAGPVLAVIGQLAPWKAQDDAIRCLSQLHAEWPTASLLIVGKAVFTSKATRYDNIGYVEVLKRLSADLGLQKAVHFLGEREDIPEILSALDVLLVPSWREPFGRSVIEAMAMRVPVVATDVGGPAELITQGVDGLLLPPRNPSLWAREVGGLLGQPRRRIEMGRRAHTTADGFSRSEHVTRVLRAYQEVLVAN
jgi:glycosyltransferase involved in cell wall biosynthesis